MMMQKTMKIAALAAVGMLALTGCSKKKGEIPKSAEGRLQAFADQLPANSEASLYIPDFAKAEADFKKVNSNLEALVSELGAANKQVKDTFEIDLTDMQTLATKGIAAKSGAAIGFVAGQTAVMTYVEKPEEFDKFMAGKVKEEFGEGAEIKKEKVGEADVQVLVKGEQELAWTYMGKMVIIGTNALDEEFKATAKPAKDFVASLAKTDAKQSRGAGKAFGEFKGSAKGYSMVGFVDFSALKGSPLYDTIKKEAVDGGDPQAKEGLDWVEKNTEYLGFGIGADGNTINITGMFGGSDEYMKQLATLGEGVADSPFVGFSTDEINAGIRLAANFGKSWEVSKAVMPKDQLEQITKALEDTKKNTGIDVEQDIFMKLSGNIGVFFYGLDMTKIAEVSRNPAAAANAVSLAAAIEFVDAASLNSLVDKVVGKFGMLLDPAAAEDPKSILKPVPGMDGAKMIALPQDAGSIIINDKLLVYATGGLSSDQLGAYIANKADAKKLQTKLGAPFAAKKAYNGLFVSVSALQKSFGPMLAMAGPEIAQAVKVFEEASLSFDADANTASVTLAIETKSSEAK